MIDEFGAILHAKWKQHPNSRDIIIGNWAEDENEYKIIAPFQLVSSIIKLQNIMCDLYTELNTARTRLSDLERFLKKVFK